MSRIEANAKQRRVEAEKRRRARSKTYAFTLYKWKEEIPETPLKGKYIPKPRSGHRIVYYRGLLYSFGGYNPQVPDDDEDLQGDPFWEESKPLFKELWRFNTFSKKWKKLFMDDVLVPDQLASHTAVVHKEKMIVYGGTGNPFGQITSNSVFMLDLDMKTWSELETSWRLEEAEADIPPPLYGQAVIVNDGNFYTVGGTSGFQYFMDVHRLNLGTRKWECLYKTRTADGEPIARYRHELCCYDNRLYVLGGGTSFEAFGFEELSAFNVETRQWSVAKTKPDASVPVKETYREQFPEPRRCHSCVQTGKYVFMFGGFDGEVIMRGMWRLDLERMTWHILPFDLPKPVYFHSSSIAESGKAYSFGGVSDIDCNARTNKLYSCWVKIPTLREMCWEALNYYTPNLDTKNVPALLGEGVPRDMLEKLHEGHI